MKRTKILATIGPASFERIAALHSAGADAFRINMSHGTPEQWRGIVSSIRELAPTAPIIMDTKGPEIRLLNVKGDVLVTEGEDFSFGLTPNDSMPYLSHPQRPHPGQAVLFDDGLVATEVVSVEGDVVKVRVRTTGLLTDRRKVTITGATTTFPVISDNDKQDLSFCRELGVDAIALSFTRCAADVEAARACLDDGVMIIAKIENSEGVANIEEIISSADGIMVARGDLGVEMSFDEVPLVQKRIVRRCNRLAKPVIVATQMLESMTQSARPTRAEASDVANAIIDGADAVMLSAETATGKYPVEAVSVMSRIAARIDPSLQTNLLRVDGARLEVAEAISNAVFDLSLNLGVDAIVSATSSGFTARMVSRFRPHARLIAVAHSDRVMRQLRLTWGVEPLMFADDGFPSHETILHAVRSATDNGLLHDTDVIIATAGVDTMKRGSTNLIEVHQVGELLRFHSR